MSRDRADWIKSLFAAALELEHDARAAYLRDSCGDDTAARAEIESLLAAEEDTPDSFMEMPALPSFLGAGAAATGSGGFPPDRIGQYHIVHVLGEGGMSVVYLAEQDHPRRQVAVKVIRPGTMSGSMHARFQYEAHVLGQLKHEGIAQIYEAGTEHTPSGPLPFFAMEYVEGKALDRYVQDHDPTTTARLQILALICDAVHHAHQRGVLHRDLKPANVIVTKRRGEGDTTPRHGADDVGRPKVLDFGVARAINSDLQLTTLVTRPGQIIGTIPYMSPEQIQGDPDNLDVRSDVYALGVIGYQLLVDRLPHDLANRSIIDAARIVQETDPPSIAAIIPSLRGDVSTIIAKAMEKSKDRRYQSAAEMAADIRRYLDDEPISARPPTTFYQIKKFAKRHKGLVAGTLVGTIAVLIGLIVAVQEAVVATAARDRAQAEEIRSRQLAYRASITAAASELTTHNIALARHDLEEIPPSLRRWEWKHLYSRLDHSLADIEMPGSATPGKPYFVTSGADCMLHVPLGDLVSVWDPRTGARVSRLEKSAPLYARSRNGAAEASLAGDLLTVVFEGHENTYSLTRLGATDVRAPGHLLTSGDARYVAVAGPERVWRIDLVAQSTAVLAVDRRQTGITNMALFEDGTIAIAAALRGLPVIWDASTDAILPLLDVPDFVRSVAFSADGRHLVLGMQDATVMLWDVTSRLPTATGRGHRHAVTDVAFGPGGERIASVSLDRTVRIWTADTLAPLKVLHGHDRAIWHVTFSPDGSLIATTGEDRTIRVWDNGRSEPVGVLARHDNIVFPVVFSPDGSLIASAGWDNSIRLADSESHTVFATILIEADVVTALCFSPNMARLAAVTNDGLVAWDLTSGSTLPLPDAEVLDPRGRLAARALSFDADSVHVVLPSTTAAGWLVWNTDTGAIEQRQEQDPSHRHSPLFGPNGRFLIRYAPAGSSDPRTARSDSGVDIGVFDLTTGKRCDVPDISGAFAFGLTPARHVILAARLDRDRTTVTVWDLTAGQEIGQLQGHAENVYAIAYSPDFTRIATAARDSLRLWDAQTFEEIVQLQGHTSFVWSVAFSPDGTQLISGSGDRTVRVWDTVRYRERSLIRQERERALLELTPLIRKAIAHCNTPQDALTRILDQVPTNERKRRVAVQATVAELLHSK